MTDDFPRPMTDDDQPTDAGEGRLDELPPFETDADRTVGGGVAAEGGTAIKRGTGELGGQAQGPDRDDEGKLPSIVDLGDHERHDVDDPAAPGIDDYTN